MMKTALLAATTLITLAASSQAGPSWKEVLKEVVIASNQPQRVYVVPQGFPVVRHQGYCYCPPRGQSGLFYTPQPQYRPQYREPQVVIIEERDGTRWVQPRSWSRNR